jgi:chromosome segregation ATPase
MTLLRQVFVCGALLIPVAASAQPATAAPPDILRELLTEVRGLRLAMERAATVGARIQLLVARVQLQEQRISELSRRLVTVRDEMGKLEAQGPGLAAQIKMFEQVGTNPGMPAEQRAQFEPMLSALKSQLAGFEKQRQDLANEESMLTQQISADQGRWADVNSQLDDIERSLSAPRKQ